MKISVDWHIQKEKEKDEMKEFESFRNDKFQYTIIIILISISVSLFHLKTRVHFSSHIQQTHLLN